MMNSNQFCTFYLADQFFGVEVSAVQEVIRYQSMTRVPLAHPVIEGLINLRGQIVTAIDLRRRLGLEKRPGDQEPMNVVIQMEDGAMSLLVDEIGDVLDLSGDQFEETPMNLQGEMRQLIQGVFKLKDRLLLVLDTKRVARLELAKD